MSYEPPPDETRKGDWPPVRLPVRDPQQPVQTPQPQPVKP
jgi:hypothetical protein